ncbi:MAG TPA: VWA domain-containing protein [Bryobacteraceae bacterium]
MPASFRTKVNLVLVPVVVRDRKGKAVGTLKKEDFELFDKGKPQAIAKFSVEKAGSQHIEFEGEPVVELSGPALPGVSLQNPTVAERYTMMVFDDLHLNIADLMVVRVAAEKHLATALLPTERVGVYTTSGRIVLGPTEDREKLVATLRRIQPVGRSAKKECPPISTYQAYEIDRCEGGPDCPALQKAIADTYACMGLSANAGLVAADIAKGAAHDALAFTQTESRETLASLKTMVRGLAAMPGERNLLLVSPGFYAPFMANEISEVIDLAIRSRVVINSLDARGLHTLGIPPDASVRVVDPTSNILTMQYERYEASASTTLLEELAEDTGGSAFGSSNDLVGGFNKLTATPEYTYILGFSPQNLKFDGKLHTLRVKIRNGGHFDVQARHGYFAPKRIEDPAEQARQEIEEAMFSREVLRDLPVELHTQFFKSGEFEANLTVLARINLSQLPYTKTNGRNVDHLTIVAALFDKDGNLIKGSKKLVDLNLKDATLEDKVRSTVTFKSNFDVKIGGYIIRLIVRDSEGQLMTAQNGSVIIP